MIDGQNVHQFYVLDFRALFIQSWRFSRKLCVLFILWSCVHRKPCTVLHFNDFNQICTLPQKSMTNFATADSHWTSLMIWLKLCEWRLLPGADLTNSRKISTLWSRGEDCAELNPTASLSPTQNELNDGILAARWYSRS